MGKTKNGKRIAMFSIHSDPLAPLGSQECGGQNIYIKYLAEELGKLGWRVDIFTRWDNLHKKKIAFISKNSRAIRLKGGPAAYVSKQNLFGFFPELFKNFLKFTNFKNCYDLFHGHYWDGGAMALMASQKFKKSLVQNFHSIGIVRMETKKRFSHNSTEDEYFAKRINMENNIIKHAAAIISLAESEKENLRRFYGCVREKVHVIRGGVNMKHWPLLDKDASRGILNIDKKAFVLLFVGRLEWRKGIGTIISAVRLLKENIFGLKALVVGGKIFGPRANGADSKEYNRLCKKAQEEGVGDLIDFTGSVDHGRLPVYYRAADVFVIPSYYEPFGLVALEGMASRVPVVASNVDGLAATIQDRKTGLLFEPRNALSLAQKIMTIYNSKDISANLANNAYDEVSSNYSWKKIAGKISDLYDSLINKNMKEDVE